MTNMERKLKYMVFPEDGAFIARCLDVEVASEGDTEEEALANLQEALELYFEDHENNLA
ncbi:MAG: type II toxin-antitoxin system HicB family antitoxin [Sulfuricellaceae bacterium]